MTPPRSIIGALSQSELLRRPGRRRSLLAVLVLICGLLTFYPERYRAAVTMTPTDPSSLGLSGALGQLGALNTVFGSQAAVEVALKIGRSTYARNVVIQRLDLVKRLNFRDEVEASRWLEKAVEIRSLRGGIVQIECLHKDPAFGKELVAAMAEAMRERLAEIARRQTAYKRDVLVKLVAEANDRLAEKEAEYNTFRLKTRYSDPGFAIGAIGERIPVLQAAIKAKEVELSAARQFATDDNMSVRQIVAEIGALKTQLAQFQALNPDQSNSIGRVVRQSTQAEKLERELALAKSLYYNYRRYLEGTSVEDLTSAANIRILEPPFVDTGRQINFVPMALGLLLVLLGLATEFYWMRPPLGEARPQE
jgi:tyrosine-protein kinase Etk/Wzc